MTNEPSPRQWHLEGKCIYTAHGDFIGEMEHTDDARLVVDAVNERERLRDIVRRLLMLRRGDIAIPMDMEKQILREARAALGAGEKPTEEGVG